MCLDTKLFTNIQNGAETPPSTPVGKLIKPPKGTKLYRYVSNTMTGA